MEHNSNSTERMRMLDNIESNVYQVMSHATQALNEFGKDKPSIKNVEGQVNQFLKSLENVESNVSKQLQYLAKVSTLHPHEGSCYASNKVSHMAIQRLEHVRSSLNELEQLKLQHQLQLKNFQNARNPKNEKLEAEDNGQVEVKMESETN